MIVISDTTPIISLMKTGQLELLQKLFGTVYIPKAVYQELTENEMFSEEVRMVQECEFFYVERVDNEKSVTILRNFTGLDAGESEAIILADEKCSDVLLMDEHRGRQVAKKMGITITGYYYQFDYYILKLLKADDNDLICIEGIEDVDITDKNGTSAIQCKYYAKTELKSQ